MNNSKMVFAVLLLQLIAFRVYAEDPAPAEQCLLKRDTIDNPSISNDLTIDKIATEIAGFGDRYLNSLNKKSPLKDKIEKYIYSCEMLKVEIKDNLIPWTSTPDEIKKKKYDKQKNLTEN